MNIKELAEKYTNGNELQAKVLLNLGFPWPEEINGCIYEIFLENLSILKFLHSLDIPFSKDLLTKALGNDRVSFETIKWLRSVGAYWDKTTFEKALYNDRSDRDSILKWIIKEDCEREPECLETIIYDWSDYDRNNFMLWVINGCP